MALSSALVVAACNGGNQPPAGAGPQFLINSPQAGSMTAGTFFFSVQPVDPAQVASVAFSAAGASLGTDANGADGFRIFVSAADHAAGELVLAATVTGKDGRVRTRSVTVANVPEPPSTATVGAGGAALGTLEASGALSTLVLPPGTAQGATVSFEARSKEEVRLATGVDYDALGVTFLGAQEIETSSELDRPVSVSSGGFGPLVQPGQVVVNYMIGPDADGDGVGELVVVNTASVAPNGDVVSDPVSLVQVGETIGAAQQGVLRSFQLGSGVAGPPGTMLEIPVAGFNASSPFGSIARFERAGVVTELVGTIGTGLSGAQTFVTLIPQLPPGAATLTLVNLGSGYASEPIQVTVQAAPAVPGDPAAVVEAAVDAMLEFTAVLGGRYSAGAPETAQKILAMGASLADIVGGIVESLQDPGNAGGGAELAALASLLQVANVASSFTGLSLEVAAGALRPAQSGGCNNVLDRADKSFNAISNGSSAADKFSPGGLMQSWMIGQWWDAMKDATRQADSNLGGNACPPPEPPPPGPGGAMSPSGMGSAPPPGGSLGGGSWSGGSLYLRQGGLTAQQLDSAYQSQRGRFVVKVSVQGSATPFSGASDAGGYFFVPMVPAGEPFIAVAIDTETGELRSAEGIGPELGESQLIFFDFAGGESSETFIAWDGGGDGQDWHDPLNWDTDRLPLPSDMVTIDQPGANVVIDIFNLDVERVRGLRLLQGELTVEQGNLRLARGSTVEGTLALAAGNLRLDEDLVVSGQLDWVAGTVYGPGEVRNEGQIVVTSGFGVRELVGSRLINSGQVRVTGVDFGGALRLGAGTVFENLPGAVFELDGEVSLAHTSGGERPVFYNRGTILRTGGPGTSSFMAVLHNEGAEIRVEAGNLWASYGGSFAGGEIEIAAGATLDLGLYQAAGTTLTELSGVLSGSGAGQLRLVGGDFAVAQAGATLDFGVGGVYWRSAGVQGPGALRNEGLLTIAQTAAGTVRQLRTALVNAGIVELIEVQSSTGLSVGQVAAFENLAGAVFDVRGDIDILNNLDLVDGEVPFVNAGSLIKSDGGGVSRLEVCYEEVGGGTVEAATGSFQFQCP